MLAEILLLVMALLFLVLGICLFLGKGAWLIAGYNTMPPEEKRRYDKKKLCRAAGSLCAVCAAALCALPAWGIWRTPDGWRRRPCCRPGWGSRPSSWRR